MLKRVFTADAMPVKKRDRSTDTEPQTIMPRSRHRRKAPATRVSRPGGDALRNPQKLRKTRKTLENDFRPLFVANLAQQA